jgi:hypothetical protein
MDANPKPRYDAIFKPLPRRPGFPFRRTRQPPSPPSIWDSRATLRVGAKDRLKKGGPLLRKSRPREAAFLLAIHKSIVAVTPVLPAGWIKVMVVGAFASLRIALLVRLSLFRTSGRHA